MRAENLLSSKLSAACHVGGYYSLKKGNEWKMNSDVFAQNKFYYIKKGRCTITIEGKAYEGTPGMCFFIPAGTRHSYINDTSAHFAKYWIHFDIYPDNESFFRKMKPVYFIVVRNPAKFDNLFKLITKGLKSENVADLLCGKAALLNLVAEYIKMTVPDTRITSSIDEGIESVLEYIDNNMERAITLEDLSGVCHLHPTHFIRSFKIKTGETPSHFVLKRKYEVAKRLIEETDSPLSEIMSRVGIIDASQFSKKFKSFYGHSPSYFRKNINAMDNAFKKNKSKHE